MSKCKTKAIQTDLGKFRDNQTYPAIIQAYSGIFSTLFNPGIFRIVLCPEPEANSEPWHIRNPGIFRTPAYSER